MSHLSKLGMTLLFLTETGQQIPGMEKTIYFPASKLEFPTQSDQILLQYGILSLCISLFFQSRSDNLLEGRFLKCIFFRPEQILMFFSLYLPLYILKRTQSQTYHFPCAASHDCVEYMYVNIDTLKEAYVKLNSVTRSYQFLR